MDVANTTGGLIDAGVVRLSFPLDLAYVRLARLVASGLGALADMSIDEIEDLRIAVNEMCTSTIESADTGDIALLFHLTDDAIRMEGSASLRAGYAESPSLQDDLVQQILGAVVDERTSVRLAGAQTFSLVKKRLSS